LDAEGRARLRDKVTKEILDKRQREILASARGTRARSFAAQSRGVVKALELNAVHIGKRNVWRHPDQFPNGSDGFADVRRGDAHLRIPVDGDRYAFPDGTHELAHLIAEPCEGPDHVNTPFGGWRRCLACEVAAWEIALTLSPRCLLKTVHARGVESLATYTDYTPGTTAAFRRIDMFKHIAFKQELTNRRLQEVQAGI
jgi:hypothetical protein